MKELKIEVPKGYEIDKENSTFECIKFKEKEADIKTWDDLCEVSAISEETRLSGYCIGEDSNIWMAHRLRVVDNNRNVFLTEKEAKSARAAAMISQLMPYYGGAITYEEWEDESKDKYVLDRVKNKVNKGTLYGAYCLLAFHTRDLRDEFLKNNKQLVKDYLMIK